MAHCGIYGIRFVKRAYYIFINITAEQYVGTTGGINMAIIIHSSDIYEKSYTPLKDNIINSIETSAKNVSTTYGENINVSDSNDRR